MPVVTTLVVMAQLDCSNCWLCCILPQAGHVFKKDLQKKKNDDEVEEGWVQCDCCDNWVHMICGLFNKGKNDQTVHYLCPTCLMDVSTLLHSCGHVSVCFSGIGYEECALAPYATAVFSYASWWRASPQLLALAVMASPAVACIV